MKKILSVLLAAACLMTLLLSFTACGTAAVSAGSDNTETFTHDTGTGTSSTASVTSEAAEPEAAAEAAGKPAEHDSGTTTGSTTETQAQTEPTTEAASAAAVGSTADSVAPVQSALDGPVAEDAVPLTTEQIAEYAQLAYSDLVSNIMVGMQDGWQSVTTVGLGISEIYAAYPDNAFGFSIQDINGDGIPELLLGETVDNDATSPIYDLFTASETGSLIHVFTGGEGDRCFLYENGSLANLSSSDTDNSSFIHYVLEDGILVADDSGESGGNYVDIAFQYFNAS